MRPHLLTPLFASLTALPGIGSRLATLIAKLIGGDTVAELLWHLPSGLIDRRFTPTVAEAPHGAIATLTVRVDQHQPPRNRRQPYKVLCSDASGTLSLVFFHGHADYLRRTLPEGEIRIVSGRIELFGQQVQMTHPDHIAPEAERARLQSVEPVYPLTAGLSGKVLAKAVAAALERLPQLPEWQDQTLVDRHHWPTWHDALRAAHAPNDENDLAADTPPRRRLAYDELLANQLALALVRLNMRRVKGRSLRGDGRLTTPLRAALPYTLTGAQEQALKETLADMASEIRMLRLIQGDVGSGKTIVAVIAMLTAVEAGTQAALMAPTEILARQHVATLSPLAETVGCRVGLLTGRETGRKREQVLADLASGAIQLIVGTHALFQDPVTFHDLGLAVIDEQHRFGVHQRLTLASKGAAVDVMVMTATPIPRTLMLTAYGDMDVSRLLEKPAGRQPIDTRTLPMDRLAEVISGIGRAITQGARVYWICPLVEESELLDVTAVEDRYRHLCEVFGERVVLAHGRLKGPEKDRAMAAFAAGEADILVATTVIEVGVDVPEATVMVIEHAERFGLAQLHQLRGRVGRGAEASSCLLLYGGPLSETARARLAILRQTDDGFIIAEEDLRLRGAGELLGVRQSGLPEFRLADLAAHGDLLSTASSEAKLILERDASLESPRGQALRNLLYLFRRDEAIRLLRSG